MTAAPSEHHVNLLWGWTAEEVIAWGTVGLFVATALLFIATYALFRTASRDGERSLKQARELFAVERRPWLQVAIEVTSDMCSTDDGLEFNTVFTVTNVGLAPAFGIQLKPRTALERIRPIHEAQLGLANDIREDEERRGDLLFPGESLRERYAVLIKKDEITAAEQHTLEITGELPADTTILVAIHPYVYGTVRYQFFEDSTVHQTGFLFRLGAGDEADRIPLSMFPAHPLTKDKFRLFRNDRGFWAD